MFVRDVNVMYDMDTHNDSFIIKLNNPPYINYRIVQIPTEKVIGTKGSLSILDVDSLNPFVIYKESSEFIELHEVFKECVVLWIRKDGLREIQIIGLSTNSSASNRLSFKTSSDSSSESYAVFPATVDDMESRIYRSYSSSCLTYTNSSFSRQPSMYWYNFQTQETYAQNEQKVHEKYLEKRLWIQSSSSSARIPVSIVYLKGDSEQDRPTVINSYGSYGSFKDPKYNSDIFPLLNRGMIYALCHPR